MQNRKRILIIEIEIDLCLLMKTFFLRKNYDVFISHSADDGLLRIEECLPNMIFISTAAYKNPDRDIEEIKAAVPYAEIIINSPPS